MHVSTIRLPWWIGTIAVLLLYAVEPVSGQGFLQRLEERVRERLEEGAVIPPAPPENAPLAPDRSPRVNDRPRLGVEVDEVPGSGSASDVVVAVVHPNSAAAAAGLKPGDRITRLGGASITSVQELLRVLQRSRGGDRLLMSVQRDGEQVDLAVRLGTEPGQNRVREELPPPSPARPDFPPASPSPTEEAESVPPDPVAEPGFSPEESGHLGLTVEDPPSTRGRTLTRGAKVVEIVPGAPGAEAGLQVGDTIVSFDGTLIPNAESMILQMRRTRPGQRIELQYVRNQKLGRVSVTLGGTDDLPGKRSDERAPDGRRSPRETASRNADNQQMPPRRVPAESGLGALGSALGGLFGGRDAAEKGAADENTEKSVEENKNSAEAENAVSDNAEILPSPSSDVPPSLKTSASEEASQADLQETIRRLEATNRRLESRLQQLEERMQAILQATADEE